MRDPVTLSFRSPLAAPRSEVWAIVSTMSGVNAELRPWIRMTHPRRVEALDVAAASAPGEVLFRSWLLVLRVLPFDRHAFTLVSVDPGSGFVEESQSWLQRRWHHERRIADGPGSGCTVIDELLVEPRIGVVAPTARHLVQRVFEHRHHVLRRRFGSTGEPDT